MFNFQSSLQLLMSTFCTFILRQVQFSSMVFGLLLADYMGFKFLLAHSCVQRFGKEARQLSEIFVLPTCLVCHLDKMNKSDSF